MRFFSSTCLGLFTILPAPAGCSVMKRQLIRERTNSHVSSPPNIGPPSLNLRYARHLTFLRYRRHFVCRQFCIVRIAPVGARETTMSARSGLLRKNSAISRSPQKTDSALVRRLERPTPGRGREPKSNLPQQSRVPFPGASRPRSRSPSSRARTIRWDWCGLGYRSPPRKVQFTWRLAAASISASQCRHGRIAAAWGR